MLELLHKLFIGPIDLYFEIIYRLAVRLFGTGGLIVIPMSLAVSFICLPLYRRAEAIQAEERQIEKGMEAGLFHIRRAFSGDERFLMQQAYYRISRYHPIYVLKSTLPLLLQVPFFISAYRFLSGLGSFKGASFGPITDLGTPDCLLTIAGFSVNLLPVLMTLINLLSGAIYSKGHTKREKIQLFAVAAVFLVLLYQSPSGLVLYWTCNNLFSLVRNLIDNAPNGKFMRSAVFSGLAAFFFLSALLSSVVGGEHLLWAYAIAVLFLIPVMDIKLPKRLASVKEKLRSSGPSAGFSLPGCLLLTLSAGVLIPTAVIKSSPAEFVILSAYRNPLLYVMDSAAMAAGLFLVWFGILYYLSEKDGRRKLNVDIVCLCGIAMIDYLFFGTKLGTLTSLLRYEAAPTFTVWEKAGNALVLAAAVLLILWLWKKNEKAVRNICSVMVLVVIVMSAVNAVSASSELSDIRQTSQEKSELASYSLSKSNKNVVVLMLDKAISSYVPYLFQEKPELKEQFDGFTWYPNTISYGWGTNTGSPAIYGGYEYTPEEMNRRSDELLGDKHNEALKLMPVLFDEAGFNVTVSDAPYAGYKWYPDLSIYDDYPDIQTYLTNYGQFRYLLEDFEAQDNTKETIWRRNFFYYSLMKMSPVLLQSGIYEDGRYLNVNASYDDLTEQQHQTGLSEAVGINGVAVDNYASLMALSEITDCSEGAAGSFLMLYNCTAHDTMLYQTPAYEPSMKVDNTGYDMLHADRFSVDGISMNGPDERQMRHYHANMAALLLLGNWFDHLREIGVYDNTRIILVADHDLDLGSFDALITEDGLDIMRYNPLLMVKDFNEKGFHTDNTFMTNADTPMLAFSGIINDPVNPFTGQAVSDEAKHSGEQHIMTIGGSNQVNENNGTVFQPGQWYALRGEDALNRNNWTYLGKY